MADREECYERIRGCMVQELTDYYRKFPDRQLDKRSIASIASAYQGLERVLSVLEDYDIVKKKDE
jgi:hypothetical protein